MLSTVPDSARAASAAKAIRTTASAVLTMRRLIPSSSLHPRGTLSEAHRVRGGRGPVEKARHCTAGGTRTPVRARRALRGRGRAEIEAFRGLGRGGLEHRSKPRL